MLQGMRRLSLVAILPVLFISQPQGSDWPAWRGPEGIGVSREERAPLRWGRSENVAWRAPLRGVGSSTPIIWGERIFLTSQLGSGPVTQRGMDFDDAIARRSEGEADQVVFLIEAFDRSDGGLLWEYRLEAEGDELPTVHRKHNLASPSCATDGELVFAWFGTGQLVALDLEGRKVWGRNLGREYAPFEIMWGHGSSPALYEDLLILLCDHAPASYLLALDKRTGEERWKVDRGNGLRSYTTPLIVLTERGPELIVNSSTRLDAYDPRTGELLWHAGEANRVPIAMPVHHEGILYATRGFSSGPYLSLRLGGQGDVSETHLRWTVPTGAPYVSSLLHYRGLLFVGNELGILSCIDPETGRILWRQRLGGAFTASPLGVAGRVYFAAESGRTVVVEAATEPTILAENHLEERIVASPVVSGGRLFLRTDESLYCIGE